MERYAFHVKHYLRKIFWVNVSRETKIIKNIIRRRLFLCDNVVFYEVFIKFKGS